MHNQLKQALYKIGYLHSKTQSNLTHYSVTSNSNSTDTAQALFEYLYIAGYLNETILQRAETYLKSETAFANPSVNLAKQLSDAVKQATTDKSFNAPTFLKQTEDIKGLDQQDFMDVVLFLQQTAFRRLPGQERHEIQLPENLAQHADTFIGNARQLGVVDETQPSKQHYSAIAIMGASYRAVEPRIEYFQKLIREQAIQYDKLFVSSGYRDLQPGLDGAANLAKLVEHHAGSQDTSVYFANKTEENSGDKQIKRLRYREKPMWDEAHKQFIMKGKFYDANNQEVPADHVYLEGLQEHDMIDYLMQHEYGFAPDDYITVKGKKAHPNYRATTQTSTQELAGYIDDLASNSNTHQSLLIITEQPHTQRMALQTQQQMDQRCQTAKVNVEGCGNPISNDVLENPAKHRNSLGKINSALASQMKVRCEIARDTMQNQEGIPIKRGMEIMSYNQRTKRMLDNIEEQTRNKKYKVLEDINEQAQVLQRNEHVVSHSPS